MIAGTHRIDFREVKEQSDFASILAYYRIKATGSGAQRSALCPFHKDTRESLSVNIERRIFHCFSCDAKGDVLAFVARLERTSVREAAAIIAGICGFSLIDAEEAVVNGQLPREAARAAGEGDGSTESANNVLPFVLNLDPTHPYLGHRGVSQEVVETFGLGYCGRGYMKGRICIPIHDEAGQLVAYAGRWAADDVPPDQLRYKLPRGFKKSCVLFNLHRVAGTNDHLVLVEGYWSVFRLHAMNVPAVALMGRTLSERQQTMLRDTRARFLTLLLDADTPGRESTAKLLPRLAGCFFVRVPLIPEGEAPDNLPEELLREIVRA